jgi:hypothetical protein
LGRDRKRNTHKQNQAATTQSVSKPPTDFALKIPNPITIRQERDAAADERYTEEKETRAAQLSAAQKLNWITGCGAAAAIVSLFFLYLAIVQSRHSIEIDQRAWLSITQKGNTTLDVGSAPSAFLTITNTGKTPALRIEGHLHIEVVPAHGSPHLDERLLPYVLSVSGIALPNEPRDTDVVRLIHVAGTATHATEDDPLTQREKDDLEQGRAWIAIHGTISYDDAFKNRHWVRICLWNSLTGGDYTALSCAAYNNMDDYLP